MGREEFEEAWEQESEKEYDFYMDQTAAYLEKQVRAGNYGNHYQLWPALAAKSTLREIGWDLFRILDSNQPYLIKFHCAEALIELADAAPDGIQAAQLSAENQYNVPMYLQTMKNIIEKKIAKNG